MKDLTIQAVSGLNAADVGAVLGDLVGLVAAGRLTVEVARTYPLEEAAEAQRAVVEDRYVGKLVVDLEA
jgi:NADPH:quinone reductase-like Zn-dependent oxidoreductase